MGLTEAARQIYGLPGGDKSQLGTWYDHYYQRPGFSADARKRQVESELRAMKRREASQPYSPAAEPNRLSYMDPHGERYSGKSGKDADRTTRGLAALFSDGLGPDDPGVIERFYQQNPQIQAGMQIDEVTGLPRNQLTSSAPGSYQMAQQAAQERRGLYTEAHMRDPGNWSTEDIAKLQREMVKSGVLTERFHLGVFDNTTQAAYRGLLEMANANGGKTKGEMLAQLKATDPGDLMDQYRRPEFQKPDRAELVDGIETAFQQRLGRRPNVEERRELAQHYMQELRREFRLEVEPEARNQFAAGTVNPAQAVLGMEPETVPVRQVNPEARFSRYFDRLYKDETREAERREEQAEASVTAMQAFDQLRSMMGAGGVQQLG